ncbi:MAG TPA: hypothetical protein VGB77_12075 [Abditibacteriaceae bacterium]
MTQKFELKYAKGLLALGLVLGVSAITSQAQPGFGAGGGQDAADYRQLSPEQQELLAEKVRDFAREQMIRLMLSNAGFADKAVQDEVVSFANEQSNAMAKLNEQNAKLRTGLREQNTPAGPLTALMNEYNTAVTAENTRRKTALDALDAKINFRKQPRLEAVLTTMGVVGDEMVMAGLGGGVGGAGGRGFGGGMGGFGGGFGGFGGGGGDFGGRGFGGGGGDFGGRGGREGGREGGRGEGGPRGERGGREGGGREGRGGQEGRGRGGREGGRGEGGREGNAAGNREAA